MFVVWFVKCLLFVVCWKRMWRVFDWVLFAGLTFFFLFFFSLFSFSFADFYSFFF